MRAAPPFNRRIGRNYLDAWEPDGYEVAAEHRPILEDFILMWATARANVSAARPRPHGAIPREPLDTTDERRRFYEQEIKDSIARDHEFTPQGSRFENAMREFEPAEPPAPHVVSVRELKGLGGRYDEAVDSGRYKPTFFTRVAVGVARGMFVDSEPTKIVTYSDGTIYIQLGGGPSAGAMAGQASAIGGVVTAAKAGKIVQESVDEILDALFQEMTGSPVGPSGIKPAKKPPGVPRIYWKKTKNFESYKIYQRDDLVDLKRVDKKGRTNLERMKKGIAPIGPDGESMELHHMIQENEGALAEVTYTFHVKNYDTLHINPRGSPSNIDRSAFDAFRKRYWKNRSKEFEASR